MIKTSGALRHGLSSKSLWQSLDAQVSSLSGCFANGLPDTAEVDEASRALAEASLQLLLIAGTRRELLTQASREKMEAPRKSLAKLKRALGGGHHAREEYLARELEEEAQFNAMDPAERIMNALPQISKELNRLAEYERKATSRRDKALRRLDYLTIEAQRGASYSIEKKWCGASDEARDFCVMQVYKVSLPRL